MGQEKVTLSPTEIVDPAGREFDRLPVALQLERLLASQAQAVEAIRKITDQLAAAVEAATDRLRGSEGRLVYAGAGCSIRIGVQDGVELVPTFGWPLNRLIYLIAGDAKALAESVEDAEDDVDDAVLQVEHQCLTASDVVIGIAASGNTPFTCQVLAAAKVQGALTIGVSSNPAGQLVAIAEHGLVTETGPEVLAGSTRLGAGTAQKALLNAFSTALMTQLGRVLGNEMLCVQATNAKLKDRQARILAGQIDGFDQPRAYQLLRELNWDLRTGLLVASGWDRGDAQKALLDERPFSELLRSS
ncbi:N-acetylmuramic acid 6-phosphate etherase [Litorivicinus sp.]|nr:N-acetylmuramic acid 6-phosphate etherase [Litorivicinus sp.]